MDEVLVAYATGHRSTGEVALAIGDQLTRFGLSVHLRPFERAGAAENYCALVAGCAVRNDHWEDSALEYLGMRPDQSPARTHLFQWYPDEQPGILDPRVRTWLTGEYQGGPGHVQRPARPVEPCAATADLVGHAPLRG